MKIDWAFPKQVGVALGLIGALGWYLIWAYGSHEIAVAAAAGALMATVNVLVGFASIEYCQGKSATTFFKVVLGGMGIRLLAMALCLVFLLRVLHLHAGALVGSLGIFYAVYLVLEVLFIQKKVSVKS